MKEDTQKKLLTVKQLANRIECSTDLVYSMAKADEIPYYNLRGQYRFNLDEVLEALKNKPVS